MIRARLATALAVTSFSLLACTHDFYGALGDGGSGGTASSSKSTGTGTGTASSGTGGCGHANGQVGVVPRCVNAQCGGNKVACCTEGQTCWCSSPPINTCKYTCSGASCQAAACVAASRDCEVDCAGCTLSLPAGGSDPLDVLCSAGAKCDSVTCSGSPCCLNCDGASSSCTFTCAAQSTDCKAGCTAGAHCNVDCESASCSVYCEKGATCVVTGAKAASANLECGNGEWKDDCKGTLTCAP
jgi:hypothetical protein